MATTNLRIRLFYKLLTDASWAARGNRYGCDTHEHSAHHLVMIAFFTLQAHGLS